MGTAGGVGLEEWWGWGGEEVIVELWGEWGKREESGAEREERDGGKAGGVGRRGMGTK